MRQDEAWTAAIDYFTLLSLAGFDARRIRTILDLPGVSEPHLLTDHAAEVARLLGVDRNTVLSTRGRVEESFQRLPLGTQVLARGSREYPRRLGSISSSPPFLFVRGNRDLLDQAAVAIVGTRTASSVGMQRARRLAALLAGRGIVTISGLARGIDQAAHCGALDAGGNTVAVLGTPLHMTYPREHRELQEFIGLTGAVVSQFPPCQPTTRANFPLRNATMSGLSLATVVMECGETSGALIQARQCLKQGRRLFIPRSVADDRSLRWPRRFLEREGAFGFDSLEDLLSKLGPLTTKPEPRVTRHDPEAVREVPI